MITSTTSVLNKNNVRVATVKRYIEDGVVLAEGTSVLYAIEDYLTNLGYDLDDPDVQEWRVSPSYPKYEVSDLGLVRIKGTNRILYPCLKDEYVEGDKSVWRTRVGLSVDGKKVSAKPHRLVAEAFLGEEPEGHLVSHKNDIPIDNRLINLRYETPAVNVGIKLILGDLKEFYITNSVVDYVYSVITDVLEENLGINTVLQELDYIDIEEVREYTDLKDATISAIYEFKTKGTGMFSEFVSGVDGRLYLPDPSTLLLV